MKKGIPLIYLLVLVFAGILFLALHCQFYPGEKIDSRLMGICFLAGGGIVIAFLPLLIKKI